MKNDNDSLTDNPTPFVKSPSYSQLGAISDPSLSSLRDQIKKVMIPMLIKIFQLKLELSQSISLPSRIQPKLEESPEQITDQLKHLDEDLKLLTLWCESSRNQIAKALTLSEEEQKQTTTTATDPSAHLSVTKSFSHALSSQNSFLKAKEGSLATNAETSSSSREKRGWLRQFFSRKDSP